MDRGGDRRDRDWGCEYVWLTISRWVGRVHSDRAENTAVALEPTEWLVYSSKAQNGEHYLGLYKAKAQISVSVSLEVSLSSRA